MSPLLPAHTRARGGILPALLAMVPGKNVGVNVNVTCFLEVELGLPTRCGKGCADRLMILMELWWVMVGVCKQCSQALAKMRAGFQKLKQQGSELKK